MSPPISPTPPPLQPPFPPTAIARGPDRPDPPPQHQQAAESLVNAAAQHVAPTCPPTSDELPQMEDQATNSSNDSLIPSRQAPDQEETENAITAGTPPDKMEPTKDAQTVRFSSSSPASYSTHEYPTELTEGINEPRTSSRAPNTASSQMAESSFDFGSSRDIGSVSSFLVQSLFCVLCTAVRCEAFSWTFTLMMLTCPLPPTSGNGRSEPFQICC